MLIKCLGLKGLNPYPLNWTSTRVFYICHSSLAIVPAIYKRIPVSLCSASAFRFGIIFALSGSNFASSKTPEPAPVGLYGEN